MDIPHFVNTLTSWWVFDLYPVWAIINKVALNILVNVFVWANNFISLGQISQNRMAGSYGQRMFKFLTNSTSVFYNCCAGFHSHQQCLKINYIPFGAAIYSLNYFMLIDGTFNIFYTSVNFFCPIGVSIEETSVTYSTIITVYFSLALLIFISCILKL